MSLPVWVVWLARLFFVIVVVLPLVQLCGEAFWVDGALDSSALSKLMLTSHQWRLLGNSLVLATGASAIALFIGVPYALLVEKSDFWGRSFFKLAYLVPLLIPPYMQATAWGHLLAYNSQFNTFLVTTFNLTESPLSVYNLPGAIFVLGLAYFPFITLLTISGLKSVDNRYEEAALLQQGRIHTFFRITLPLVKPHIIAGIILVFIFSIIDFGVPDILRVRVYPIEIFIQFSAFYDERTAVVMGLPLLFITLFMVSLQVRVMRGRKYVAFADGFNRLERSSPRLYSKLGSVYCPLIVGVAVFIPLGILLKMAGPLSTYQKSLSSSWQQIGLSFFIAAVAAFALTILAFIIAHAMFKSSPKTRTFWEYLTQLPFAVPPILLGLALIKIWNRPETDWLYGSYLIIIIGYLAHFIPFTIRVVYASLQQLNPQLEEVGWLNCKNRFLITTLLTVPLIKNGLLAGFFISFVLALGELGVTLLVIPPGVVTIPIKIYNFMHYGAEDRVAALSLILFALQALLFLGLFRLSRWVRPGLS